MISAYQWRGIFNRLSRKEIDSIYTINLFLTTFMVRWQVTG